MKLLTSEDPNSRPEAEDIKTNEFVKEMNTSYTAKMKRFMIHVKKLCKDFFVVSI